MGILRKEKYYIHGLFKLSSLESALLPLVVLQMTLKKVDVPGFKADCHKKHQQSSFFQMPRNNVFLQFFHMEEIRVDG